MQPQPNQSRIVVRSVSVVVAWSTAAPPLSEEPATAALRAAHATGQAVPGSGAVARSGGWIALLGAVLALLGLRAALIRSRVQSGGRQPFGAVTALPVPSGADDVRNERRVA